MAVETTKCPMCGTKLKMVDGKMTCKKCGYYVRAQSTSTGASGADSYSSSGSGSAWQSSSGQVNAGNTWQQSGSSAGSGFGQPSGGKKKGETNPAVAIVTAAILGIACVAFLAVIVLFRAGVFDSSRTGENRQDSEARSSGQSRSSEPAPDSEQASDSEQAPDYTDSEAILPRTDFFCSVSEAIWGKEYTSISAQEYASLIYLEIDRDEKTLYSQLAGEETQSLTFLRNLSIDLSDLASFTGLQYLYLDDDLDVGDLKGLDQLVYVYSENTLDELARIIPHPENIVALGVQDSIFNRNLDGLDNFPALLSLEADYDSLEDISALLQFPDLLSLSLKDCDNLTDYSPLMSLTSLQSLSIDSSQLKSIDFVKQMPDLTGLGIANSQISTLSALESCPGLTELSLMDNYSVEDYAIVGQLSQLTSLELGVNYGGDLPSFAGLPQLEWLSLKYAGDLTPLTDATGILYLSLEDCSGHGLEALASLVNLQELKINDFSSYTESLAPLTRLPNLTWLTLEDTSVFGNVEEIFGIPTLQYLSMEDCQIGMDFDRLPANEALAYLSLSSTSILKDPSHNNGDKVSLSEHYDMFAHFPNLTELYLASLNLDSIEFVKDLPLLQYLDITDNNVTSLKPLEALQDFHAVWCGRNTILENVSEDSYISVITED